MKVIPSSPSILATAAHAALYAGSRLVPAAAKACDQSIFDATPSAVLVNQTRINVGLAGDCIGEGLFQMPRMTWTIEPNPDDSETTTSVYLSPSNVGTVVTGEFGDFFEGIQINPAAVANAAEVAVLIQAPKDGLGSVNIQDGAPFYVNIVKGFTDLTDINIGGGSTCNPVRGGSYIEPGCPQCKDLYTPEEVRGIGPSIVADLSDVNVEDKISDKWTFIRSIEVISFYDAIYNLSLALPEYGENGVPVIFDFEAASSKVEIKGNFDCAFEFTNMTNGGQCVFESSSTPGCKDCSNELIIDGSFNGYFNVSGSSLKSDGSSPLNVEMSGDGCVRLAPRAYDDSIKPLVNCTEGNVTVDVEPFPCISADIGTVECGADPYRTGWDEQPCFCVVPLPASECKDQPSTGFSLGADWIVYLSLPIVGVFLAL